MRILTAQGSRVLVLTNRPKVLLAALEITDQARNNLPFCDGGQQLRIIYINKSEFLWISLF